MPTFFRTMTLLSLFIPISINAIEVDLEGIDDDLLERNITAHLSTLTAPSSCQSGIESNKNILDVLTKASRAVGYYNTLVKEINWPDSGSCERVGISLEAGAATTIIGTDIQLLGGAKNDPQFVAMTKQYPLVVGSTLHHGKHENTKKKWLSQLLSQGYFDAQYKEQKIKVNQSQNTAEVRIVLDSGLRYQFGSLLFEHDTQAQALIAQVSPFESGQHFTTQLLAQFNSQLKQTGYFQQVVARPLVNSANELQIPIEIIAKAKPRDLFNLGGGASTDTGPRARFKWQRPWVNSDGHSMQADAFVSAPLQSATFNYKVPLEDPLENYLTFQAGLRAEDDNDTNSEAITLAIQRHWGSEQGDWKKIGFIRYEHERFTQAMREEQTTRLLVPGATLSRHRTKGGLDVYWGDQQQFTIESASSDLLSDIDFSRLTIQSKWVRSFDQHRIFVRAELGAIATSNFDQVPSSFRYFAGGDQSVRGFAYESLSPLEEGELVGGRYLSVASIEYTYPLSEKWRLATFIDAGNASEEPFKNLARSAGIGGRWMSPIGPLRLYLAWGKNRQESTFRIHFAMGPEL